MKNHIRERIAGTERAIADFESKIAVAREQIADCVAYQDEEAFLPKDFTYTHPWGSRFSQSEYETVASNIMKILARTGNTWRLLSKEEYLLERAKDYERAAKNGVLTSMESDIFDYVVKHTFDEESTRNICRGWAELS